MIKEVIVFSRTIADAYHLEKLFPQEETEHMSEKVLGPLTDNCKIALEFLQSNDQEWVGSDLAAASGVKGIHPVMNSLVKRGLVVKGTATRDFTSKAGVTMPKDYVTYSLTDAGRDYIIE